MRTSGQGQSALLLLDVIQLLATEQVAYAVVGAMAASVHGVVRASIDADAVLSLTIGEAASLERKFKAAGFHTELRRGDHDDPIPALLALSDMHGNRVDLLIGLRGLESAAISRGIDVPFQGATLRVIGREDFIAMKVFAGGPQDMADARRALAVAADSVDRALLTRLTQRYGRSAMQALERLLDTTETPDQP